MLKREVKRSSELLRQLNQLPLPERDFVLPWLDPFERQYVRKLRALASEAGIDIQYITDRFEVESSRKFYDHSLVEKRLSLDTAGTVIKNEDIYQAVEVPIEAIEEARDFCEKAARQNDL